MHDVSMLALFVLDLYIIVKSNDLVHCSILIDIHY